MDPVATDLDETQLAELREDLEDAFPEFVHGFLQSCHSLPGELSSDLGRGSLSEIAARAHGLKGTAGYLGATRLASRLGHLQGAAEAGDRDETGRAVQAVVAALDALVPRLTDHIERS